MDKFRKIGISEEILKVLAEHKFEAPTEIQEKSIPLVLAGKDVIAGAATGSGKTLAFGAGIIKTCKSGKGIQALVLVPTRELAIQVARALKLFSKYNPLNISLIYGGVSIIPQMRELLNADVVVGTPGRILDHLGRKTLDLSRIKVLVLDEADRMLDMGFIEDVKKIVGKCPGFRQTLLFSATISEEISKLAQNYMSHPIEVFAESQVDPTKLSQIYYDVPDYRKFALLVHLLKNDKSGLVMVFCNTQRNTDFVERNLALQGIKVLAIHGGYSQNKRSKTMKQFHEKDVDVLVCTDVAARGLDIKDVSHVYNYDAPNESNQYIHRIGRTARAGREGKAVNIIANRDYDNFRQIMQKNPDMIKKQELPEFEDIRIEFKHGARTGRDSGSSRRRFGSREFRGGNKNRTQGRQFRDSEDSVRKFGRSRDRSRSSNRFSSGFSGRKNSRDFRHPNSRRARNARHERHSRFSGRY